MKQLLLISNSTQYGTGYLDHAEVEIRTFLGRSARVAFVPFALFDWKDYAVKALGGPHSLDQKEAGSVRE
jgi:dipeptidase E